MQTVKFVYWEEDGAWVGYLQDYPDYWTQGETFDEFTSWIIVEVLDGDPRDAAER